MISTPRTFERGGEGGGGCLYSQNGPLDFGIPFEDCTIRQLGVLCYRDGHD